MSKCVRKNPLSRKYYVLIAEALAKSYAYSRIKHKEFDIFVKTFGEMLKKDNPRFNYDKFYKYIHKILGL